MSVYFRDKKEAKPLLDNLYADLVAAILKNYSTLSERSKNNYREPVFNFLMIL